MNRFRVSRYRGCEFLTRCRPAVAVVLILGWSTTVWGQIEFEQEPINYGTAPADDAIARLQNRLDAGEAELRFDVDHGYLKSVLDQLDISPASQVLVYSKTSFQLRRISPRRPRALYFNDESYVGWVQDGDVIEVMTTDPHLGEVFYTLAQEENPRPQFVRDQGQCIVCHASSRTQGVPGGLVRSVFVDAGGQPQFGSGTVTVDHRTPFEERWGGWYVTGSHGAMRHMGNVVSKDRQRPEEIDREAGANVVELSDRFDTSPYLSSHSDIVALTVLEHQTQMQNFLTRAHYEYQSATHYDGIMNRALDRPSDHVSDSTRRRIESAGEKLLRYMLFAGEFQLTAPVRGTSAFAEEFQSRGPKDRRGRSLRDLDLQSRLFKHPCSYLVYSPSFDRLPEGVKSYLARRLREVLTGKETSGDFAHLSATDRQAILEILTETKPDLWKE